MPNLKLMKSKSIERRTFSITVLYVFSIEALHQTIDEQSQQIEDLNEKTASLSFQLESQAELMREK